MDVTRSVSIVLATVLVALPLSSQVPIEGPSVFGDLSDARVNVLYKSRRLAYQELIPQLTAQPDIATALTASFYSISVARIIAVHPPAGNGPLARTRVTFHVEQFLRGKSDVTDFDVESRWIPNPPPKDPVIIDAGESFQETALDRSEPKKSDRYILGYTVAYGDGKTVFVPSVIDMQDSTQAGLIDDVKQFLTLESTADVSGFETYLVELDSAIPWVRLIAIQRLSESEACNASPVCAQRFSAVVKRQIRSKVPNERLEAMTWLNWIESVSRMGGPPAQRPDGLPILPDPEIRKLLSSEVEDSNVYLGDVAFERREMFDFYRAGKAGECIQIVPALRKSAHWPPGQHDYSGQHELLPPGFSLSSSTSCLPAEK
jgi:hypothetical protein